MKRPRGAALAALVGLAAAACNENKSQPLAAAASSLAPSSAAPSANALTFVIDPASTTTIDMPAPKEHIRAGTSRATGKLSIDPTALASTRGEVKVDLASLATKTFGDAEKDKTQSTHARTWLEVADGDQGKLPDEVKATNRYAVYAIRSVDALSASDITKVPATKDGADEVRTVTATSHGELLVHGRKVDRPADLEVQFRYAPGSPADRPREVRVRSKTPLRVTLGEHDVKPRDGFGKIAQGAFNLIGTKVAELADVSLDLRASVAP